MEVDKVFLVVEGENHEGYDVDSAWTTLAQARQRVRYLLEQAHQKTTNFADTIHREQKGIDRWSLGVDFIEIISREIDLNLEVLKHKSLSVFDTTSTLPK